MAAAHVHRLLLVIALLPAGLTFHWNASETRYPEEQVDPSCTPRHFTQDRSTYGPVQAAVAAALGGLTLSSVVISHKVQRFAIAAKRLSDIGLGVQQLWPYHEDDPCVNASRFFSNEAGGCCDRCQQLRKHSLSLTQTSAIEGCNSDWLLLFEDDAIPWVIPANGNFTLFMIQMLEQLTFDERFAHVPLVQLGVLPPYHRKGPFGNGEWPIPNHTIFIGHSYFAPGFGIGTQAVLYRCSTARQTRRAIRNNWPVPGDQMIQHLFTMHKVPGRHGTFAETVPFWPLCAGKSSSVFNQDKTETFASTRTYEQNVEATKPAI